MPKQTKKLADVKIGDFYLVRKTIVKKEEDATTFTLTFDDGSVQAFEKKTDPAMEMGE